MSSPIPTYLSEIPHDSRIEQTLLDIDRKTRSNLLAWKGQFSPQLVELLLREYAREGDLVLDQFAGSATVLCEAGRLGLRSLGVEINPSAYYLGRLYELMNVTPAERSEQIQKIDEIVFAQLRNLSTSNGWPLNALITGGSATLDEGQTILLSALAVMIDGDVETARNRLLPAWKRLRGIAASLPYSQSKLSMLNADARRIPLDNEQVDVLLTSPPYINVFNYHQQYRSATQALGWDLLHVAKSEIGSNRKHRGNRFFTVVQYCLDIAHALAEASRVCKPDARVIYVVGRESRVRGLPFFNGDLVGRLADSCSSFKVTRRQERRFVNRFGVAIVEDILHFQRVKNAPQKNLLSTDLAREVAGSALRRAAVAASPELRIAIDEALERIELISESPIYCAGRLPARLARHDDNVPDTPPRKA